ncbi:MAG: DUF1638 domain-containing protein [Butyricicoccus sp.]|nr:DUF1638 domain-containing protein [Butyricicoccus sp.]
MRIAFIGCMVLGREVNRLASESGHAIRTWWLRQGLHETPDLLRRALQEKIDEVEEENELLPAHLRFEAIVFGYGLCSNGVIGLTSRTLPLIIPRCDDCISLFLGSADRYREMFRKFDGAFWYNTGWMEHSFYPSRKNYARRRAEYAELYGEENADFLMESMNNWMTEYRSCGYITSPVYEDPANEADARQAAADFNWQFAKVEGDMRYLDLLVNGPWKDDEFLTCPPGYQVAAQYDNGKIRAVPVDEI